MLTKVFFYLFSFGVVVWFAICFVFSFVFYFQEDKRRCFSVGSLLLVQKMLTELLWLNECLIIDYKMEYFGEFSRQQKLPDKLLLWGVG